MHSKLFVVPRVLLTEGFDAFERDVEECLRRRIQAMAFDSVNHRTATDPPRGLVTADDIEPPDAD